MISYAFLSMFWALAAVRIFQKRNFGKAVAVILTVALTATGIYDFVIILRNNGPGHRVTVSMDSALTEWLCQNLDSKDLILTPEYSINEVTMSGVMMYLGWPYYACIRRIRYLWAGGEGCGNLYLNAPGSGAEAGKRGKYHLYSL